MSRFVLQYKPNVHKDKWLTMTPAYIAICREAVQIGVVAEGNYMTLEAAKAARDKMPMNHGIRIAEAYTVTRYKPVKE